MIKEFISYERNNKNLSDHTLRAYENDLRGLATWAARNIEGAKWSTLRKRDIEKYITTLHETHKPASIRRKIASIRALFNYLQKQDLTEGNPARFIESPKRSTTLPSQIDDKAIEAYLQEQRNPMALRALIALLYETGMRISEALNVDTRMVNARENSIKVYDGKGQKTRVVYYGYWTKKLMNAYLQRRRGVVFIGGSKNERAARYAINRALRGHEIGERQASPHMIRHTFATKMLNQGCPLSSLQKLLGHSKPETTQVYAEAMQPKVKHDYEMVWA